MITKGRNNVDLGHCGEITQVHLLKTDDLSADQDSDQFETRVRLGTAVTIKRYPWMVAVKRKLNIGGFALAGSGSLIWGRKDARYVLSAAHVFFTAPSRGGVPIMADYKFYIGFLNTKQKSIKGRMQIFGASKIHTHAGYNFSDQTNDIALIRLNQSVPEIMFKFKYARAICLPKKDTVVQKSFTVAGWGSNGTKFVANVDDLFEAKVDLFPGDCPVKKICTKSRPSDVCSNDSGGPLMQSREDGRMEIVGVVSDGPQCELEQTSSPGRFTDIRPYLDWIDEMIDADESDGSNTEIS